jgi:hypothetical protein
MSVRGSTGHVDVELNSKVEEEITNMLLLLSLLDCSSDSTSFSTTHIFWKSERTQPNKGSRDILLFIFPENTAFQREGKGLKGFEAVLDELVLLKVRSEMVINEVHSP